MSTSSAAKLAKFIKAFSVTGPRHIHRSSDIPSKAAWTLVFVAAFALTCYQLETLVNQYSAREVSVKVEVSS